MTFGEMRRVGMMGEIVMVIGEDAEGICEVVVIRPEAGTADPLFPPIKLGHVFSAHSTVFVSLELIEALA